MIARGGRGGHTDREGLNPALKPRQAVFVLVHDNLYHVPRMTDLRRRPQKENVRHLGIVLY